MANGSPAIEFAYERFGRFIAPERPLAWLRALPTLAKDSASQGWTPRSRT